MRHRKLPALIPPAQIGMSIVQCKAKSGKGSTLAVFRTCHANQRGARLVSCRLGRS